MSSHESKSNAVEQYGRQNNLEISGIPNSVPDYNLESTVINLLRPKKLLLFSEMQVIRKIFTWAAANLFF